MGVRCRAHQPGDDASPRPTRTAAAPSPQTASTSLPGGARRTSAAATRASRAERARTESSASRSAVVPARRLPPRSATLTAGPQSRTAASTAADDFSAYGGVVLAKQTRSRLPPPSSPRAVRAASTAMVRLSSSWLATARVPTSRVAPDGAEGRGGQSIAGNVDADPGDADGGLAHQVSGSFPRALRRAASAGRRDRRRRRRERHADRALPRHAAAASGTCLHDVAVARSGDRPRRRPAVSRSRTAASRRAPIRFGTTASPRRVLSGAVSPLPAAWHRRAPRAADGAAALDRGQARLGQDRPEPLRLGPGPRGHDGRLVGGEERVLLEGVAAHEVGRGDHGSFVTSARSLSASVELAWARRRYPPRAWCAASPSSRKGLRAGDAASRSGARALMRATVFSPSSSAAAAPSSAFRAVS